MMTVVRPVEFKNPQIKWEFFNFSNLDFFEIQMVWIRSKLESPQEPSVPYVLYIHFLG